MRQRLFVHTPAQLLSARLPFLVNRQLQPEVACQEVTIDQLDLGLMRDCAAQLAERQLTTTIHAPFHNFNPGSHKKRLQKTAHKTCQQSLQLAEALSARLIVFHPGLPYQAKAKEQERWLEHSLNFWPEYIAQARQQRVVLCLENIYEGCSELFAQLFAELGEGHFGHCFDIGHWNIFAEQDLTSWFTQLGRHVKHLHLHDNLGEADQHLPLGHGGIDFAALFQRLADDRLQPSMTLEAHKLPDLEISLQQIETYL